ncbi:hypothetical protein B484DRAFT_410904 [Ochromonadaceae sp. CCMP2298]|nr:hypothetical protein B484DRAFT_410904 [Ochromonadaceae sp. CCMP2298]
MDDSPYVSRPVEQLMDSIGTSKDSLIKIRRRLESSKCRPKSGRQGVYSAEDAPVGVPPPVPAPAPYLRA